MIMIIMIQIVLFESIPAVRRVHGSTAPCDVRSPNGEYASRSILLIPVSLPTLKAFWGPLAIDDDDAPGRGSVIVNWEGDGHSKRFLPS